MTDRQTRIVPKTTDPKPWEQQPGETAAAYRAARVYFELGANRSLLGVAEKLYGEKGSVKVPKRSRKGSGRSQTTQIGEGSVKKWSLKWKWPSRARAYDAHMASARDRGAVKAVESEEARKARLRRENDDNSLVIADQLTVRAIEMLQWPLQATTKVSEERDPASGAPVTVVYNTEPVKWRASDIPRLLIAAKMLRDSVFGPPPSAADAPTTLAASAPQARAPVTVVEVRMSGGDSGPGVSVVRPGNDPAPPDGP